MRRCAIIAALFLNFILQACTLVDAYNLKSDPDFWKKTPEDINVKAECRGSSRPTFDLTVWIQDFRKGLLNVHPGTLLIDSTPLGLGEIINYRYRVSRHNTLVWFSEEGDLEKSNPDKSIKLEDGDLLEIIYSFPKKGRKSGEFKFGDFIISKPIVVCQKKK